MNGKQITSIIFGLMLLTFACSKKQEDIPAPVEPAPEQPEVAEEIKETEKPDVHVDTTPDSLSDFDLSKINLDDIYFDFDKSELREDARATLARHSETLRANSEIKVLIEGHCDERGTEEYNLALGERRAERVREYMVSLGISSARLRTISYGELRPRSMGHDEDAWSQNRRAYFNLSK